MATRRLRPSGDDRVRSGNVGSSASARRRRGHFPNRRVTLGGGSGTLDEPHDSLPKSMAANWLQLALVRERAMQRIGFIAFPKFQVLSLCTVSVFESANILAPEPLYDLHMLSETGWTIRTSSGLSLETTRFDETEFDTLIVLGTLVDNPTFSPGLISYLRSAPSKARRVASICTGALALAEAGLLENRRATTHWAYARIFGSVFQI
jgi:hypothetical protein